MNTWYDFRQWIRKMEIDSINVFSPDLKGGIRGTVVARWTSGQQVERSILRQGHDS